MDRRTFVTKIVPGIVAGVAAIFGRKAKADAPKAIPPPSELAWDIPPPRFGQCTLPDGRVVPTLEGGYLIPEEIAQKLIAMWENPDNWCGGSRYRFRNARCATQRAEQAGW